MYLLYIRTSMYVFNNIILKTYSVRDIREFKRLSDDRCEFLYAWTDSKKYLKMFFEVRDKDKFRVKKVSNDELEYHESVHEKFKLIKTKLHNGVSRSRPKDELFGIVLTLYEEEICMNDHERIYDFITDNFSMDGSDYYILTNKYIEVLSKLGYCQLYDMLISGDDGRIGISNDNESYSIQSDVLCINSNSSVFGQINSELARFIMSFSFTC